MADAGEDVLVRPTVRAPVVAVPPERWHSTGKGLPPRLLVHPWQWRHLRERYPWLTESGETVTARPRVLPWPECPAAAGSAQLLLGTDIATLRLSALQRLRGITTCTHLTDMLRAIEDVGAIADTLEQPAPETAI